MKGLIYIFTVVIFLQTVPSFAFSPISCQNENCEKAMKNKDFKEQLKVIQETQFSETKLQLCKGLIKKNCISSKQLKELLSVFSFEQHKTEIAMEAYDKVVDQENFYQIYTVFKMENNIREIEQYIQSK